MNTIKQAFSVSWNNESPNKESIYFSVSNCRAKMLHYRKQILNQHIKKVFLINNTFKESGCLWFQIESIYNFVYIES